jgi:voltage-gated potassium channel Kch
VYRMSRFRTALWVPVSRWLRAAVLAERPDLGYMVSCMALLVPVPVIGGNPRGVSTAVWISFLLYIAFLIVLYITFIARFNYSRIFVLDPFRLVRIQLFTFAMATICFGALAYCIWVIDRSSYVGNVRSYLDMIYYSFVTVTTVGYGDITPVTLPARLLAVAEILFGLWFVVSIIPVAVAQQTERIREEHLQLRRKRRRGRYTWVSAPDGGER